MNETSSYEAESVTHTRIIIRIELTPAAKEHVTSIARQNGMTQVAVTSRLFEWFAAQPELVQAAVLGHYPHAIEAEIAQLVLKRMAAPQGKK